jgi:DNA-binding transcriptional LysR family regulator
VLLEEARRVLRLAEHAQDAARSASEHATARVRVGYVTSALPAVVPRALQALHASGAESTLDPGSPLEIIEAVRSGYLDAAVIPLPAPTTGLHVTPLRDQHAVAALPIRDPRATHCSMSLARVAPERLVVLPREANRPFYDAVIEACRGAGLAPRLVEPGDAVEQVLLGAASGAGIALLPDSVAERYAAPGMRFVELEDPHAAFATGVVTARNRDHPPTASFLTALAMRTTRAEPRSLGAAA